MGETERQLTELNKLHSKHSSALGTVSCPKCGRKGQLKKRTNGYGKSYFQVDHFKVETSHKSGYSHSCYLCIEGNARSLIFARKDSKRVEQQGF